MQYGGMAVEIDHSTRVFGVIGYPLRHTMSPLMHNRAFRAAGINGVYLAFQVAPYMVSSVVAAARTLNIEGFNVTIPHKETIIPFIDEISEAARLCGSVNTVKITGQQTMGHNTDGSGFIASLEEARVKPEGLAIILGAGGAARAIGFQMALRGCELVLVDIIPERAAILAADISRKTGAICRASAWESGHLKDLVTKADLAINTTPVGMYPAVQDRPPLELKLLRPEAVVCDIVYNPLKTCLLEKAEERGLKTVGGLGMFVNQGAQSFRIFTGLEPPIEVMRNAVQRFLQKN